MEIYKKNKSRKVHHGHNVKRFREAKGMKQEILANLLNLSQKSISRIESKEVIDDDTLEKLSEALGIPVDIIKKLEEDPVHSIIIENSTIENSSINGDVKDFDNIYHPIDKIMELNDEKEALFERLLKIEQERNAELRQELITLRELKEKLTEIERKLQERNL